MTTQNQLVFENAGAAECHSFLWRRKKSHKQSVQCIVLPWQGGGAVIISGSLWRDIRGRRASLWRPPRRQPRYYFWKKYTTYTYKKQFMFKWLFSKRHSWRSTAIGQHELFVYLKLSSSGFQPRWCRRPAPPLPTRPNSTIMASFS